MRQARLIGAALLIALGAQAQTKAPKEPLAVELDRRDDALVAAGYNFTHGISLELVTAATPLRIELFIPIADQPHRFSFWAGTGDGEIAFRLTDSAGKVLASWTGQSGELTVAATPPAGKLLFELTRISGSKGQALLGIRGPALMACAAKDGELREIAASPERGFQFPYLLYVPRGAAPKRLLVLPGNTGFPTEDPALLRTSATCVLHSEAKLAGKLGTPILIPLFPRPALLVDDDLDLHALSRAALGAERSDLRRIDLQLLAMIDDAQAALKIEPAQKIFLFGFSAAGSFAARFTMLHPERVAAVASGSPGGWPIAPAAALDQDALTYPVGIADLKSSFAIEPDPAARKKVAWLFLLGDKDENDSVVHRDSFSKADEALIARRFGATPVARFPEAAKLYKAAGLDARFVLYPGAAHAMSGEMQRDVDQFFAQHL